MVSEHNFDPRSSYYSCSASIWYQSLTSIRYQVISTCFKSMFCLFQIIRCLPNFLIKLLKEKNKKTLHPKSPSLLTSFPSTKPSPQSTLSSSKLALIFLDRHCNISFAPALSFSLMSFHHRREKTKHIGSPLPVFYSQTVLHSIKVSVFFIIPTSRQPLSTP